MASLVKVKGKPNKKTGKRGTTYRVDFYLGSDPRRKSVRLGTLTKSQAETVKSRIEFLVAAKDNGTAPDAETSRWVGSISDDLHARLAKHGLVAARARVMITKLGAFLDDYLAKRESLRDAGKLKWRTVYNERLVRDSLIEKFGADKPLDAINEGDAFDFRDWLLTSGGKGRKRTSQLETTVQKKCAVAFRFFKDAARRDLIRRNPFDSVPRANLATKSKAYISEADAKLVLDELPSTEWKLLFALSRWGGLRVGSEVRKLKWGDIDWENQRVLVHSPKTERYEGRATRLIPMFPELAGLLDKRYAEAAEGDVLVLPMLKGKTDAALIDPLERAIERSGLKRWPRLWHNLRASRQTDLERVPGLSSYVVCEWLGNSDSVARKHYLQVTDADYAKVTEKAQQKAQQQAPQDMGTGRKEAEQECENPDDFDNRRDLVGAEVPPRGFEPLSPP